MKIYLSRFLSTKIEENIKRMEKIILDAKEKNAEIVVFPELFLTGYKGKIEPNEARALFQKFSEENKEMIFIFDTITEERKNRALVYHKGYEILRYDKVNLFKPNYEDKIWEKGEEYKSVKTEKLNFGVIVCNDIRFPEGPRTLRLRNRIEVLFVVAYWPLRRNEIFRDLLRVRAIENAMYVCGCSISHRETEDEVFYGALNYVFNPLGEQIECQDDTTFEIEIPFKGKILVNPLDY